MEEEKVSGMFVVAAHNRYLDRHQLTSIGILSREEADQQVEEAKRLPSTHPVTGHKVFMIVPVE